MTLSVTPGTPPLWTNWWLHIYVIKGKGCETARDRYGFRMMGVDGVGAVKRGQTKGEFFSFESVWPLLTLPRSSWKVETCKLGVNTFAQNILNMPSWLCGWIIITLIRIKTYVSLFEIIKSIFCIGVVVCIVRRMKREKTLSNDNHNVGFHNKKKKHKKILVIDV